MDYWHINTKRDIFSLKYVLIFVPSIGVIFIKTPTTTLVVRGKYKWLENCINFISSSIDILFGKSIIHIIPENDLTSLMIESIDVSINLSQNLFSGKSIPMQVTEHYAENMPVEWRYVGGQGNALLLNHLQIIFHAQPVVAGLAHQHFVKDDAQGPNIAFLGIVILSVCFRRHIFGWADVVI